MTATLYAKIVMFNPATQRVGHAVACLNVSAFERLTDELANTVLQKIAAQKATELRCVCIHADWISSAEAVQLLRKARHVDEPDEIENEEND